MPMTRKFGKKIAVVALLGAVAGLGLAFGVTLALSAVAQAASVFTPC